MRILFVVDEPLVPTNSGGRAETRSEIELLRAQGHDVDIVMCASKRVPAEVLELQSRELGHINVVRLRTVVGATLRYPAWPLFCARRMPRHVTVDRLVANRAARGPVDVVVAAHEYTLPLATALKDRVGGRLVLRSHNDEAAYFRGLAAGSGPVRRVQYALDALRLRTRLRQLLRAVDLIALISPEDAVGYPALTQERTVVVPPVLMDMSREGDVRAFDQREERLVFVGSLDVGYALSGIAWFLARVWPLVRERRRDAVVEFVGRGAGASCRALLADTPGVVLTGEVADIGPVLDRSRVFVNPVFDGSGVNMKVGPPLSRGLPVVTTPVGLRGMQALRRGVTLASSPEEFADACCTLLSDSDRWAAASAAGRGAIDATYSRAAVAAAWERALGRVTSQRVAP